MTGRELAAWATAKYGPLAESFLTLVAKGDERALAQLTARPKDARLSSVGGGLGETER